MSEGIREKVFTRAIYKLSTILWGARPSRVLAKVSRFRELFKAKQPFNEVTKEGSVSARRRNPHPRRVRSPEKDEDHVSYNAPCFLWLIPTSQPLHCVSR